MRKSFWLGNQRTRRCSFVPSMQGVPAPTHRGRRRGGGGYRVGHRRWFFGRSVRARVTCFDPVTFSSSSSFPSCSPRSHFVRYRTTGLVGWYWEGGRLTGERKMIPFLFFLGTAVSFSLPLPSIFWVLVLPWPLQIRKRIISPLDLLGEEAHCDGERDDVDGQEAKDGQDVPKVPPLKENKNRVGFYVLQGTNEQGLTQ